MAGAKYALRGIQDFADWIEFEDARINVISGPNSSGKSALASALILLRGQKDLFRISFAEGGQGFADFLDATRPRASGAKIEFRIACSVDAAAAMLPPGLPSADPVPWNFELGLTYTADPFDGGQSGILSELVLDFIAGRTRTRLFSASSRPDGGELSLSTEDVLRLPFVRARIVGTEDERGDPEAGLERAIRLAEDLLASSRGQGTASVKALCESLRAIRREALIQREFEHIVLAETGDKKVRAAWARYRSRTRSYESREQKYLRSLSDILITECLEESGIRSMRSREGGGEIRLSFYSVFGEILEAAGFSPATRSRPHFNFPAGGDRPRENGTYPDCATAHGAAVLVLAALGEYHAWLRDAINIVHCGDANGRLSLDGSGLEESYGKTILAMREARAGEAIVPEGRDADPSLLDIEARQAELRSFLSACGLAEDLEFRVANSERSAIMLVRDGERRMLGDSGAGLRRLVVLASSLLYLPWGAFVTVEEPEAGLDPHFRAAMAGLLRRIAKTTGATLLVETRSPEFVEALGPYRRAETETGEDGSTTGAGARTNAAAKTRARAKTSDDDLVRLTELGGGPPGSAS